MESRYDNVVNRAARVDWRAAALAGLISGGVVWLLSHGTPWFTSGMISPTMMGRDLKPPGLVDPSRSILTAVIALSVAVGYTLVLAPLVTRLRGMWAVAAGGIIGLGLYALNYLIFRFLAPVDWTGTEMPVLVTHVVFSMIASGVYKGLAARRNISRAPA